MSEIYEALEIKNAGKGTGCWRMVKWSDEDPQRKRWPLCQCNGGHSTPDAARACAAAQNPGNHILNPPPSVEDEFADKDKRIAELEARAEKAEAEKDKYKKAILTAMETGHGDASAPCESRECGGCEDENSPLCAEYLADFVNRMHTMVEERAELEAKLEKAEADAATNRAISSGQARRIRELLARLGLTHAPDVELPHDEIGPLRQRIKELEARAEKAEAELDESEHSRALESTSLDMRLRRAEATIERALRQAEHSFHLVTDEGNSGFQSKLEDYIHQMWKRHPKVSELEAKLERLRLERVQVPEHIVPCGEQYLVDVPRAELQELLAQLDQQEDVLSKELQVFRGQLTHYLGSCTTLRPGSGQAKDTKSTKDGYEYES